MNSITALQCLDFLRIVNINPIHLFFLMQYNFSCALFRICMTSCKSEGRHKGNVEAPFREEMLLLLIGCDGHTSGFFCQSETFQSKFHYWTSPRGGGRCHMGNSQAAVTWLVFARLSRREEGFRRQVCVRRKAAVLFSCSPSTS